MYVCVCRAVTDKEVAAAIEGGAHSVEAVTRACGAGGDCGACRGQIEDMLEERGCCNGKRCLPVITERAA